MSNYPYTEDYPLYFYSSLLAKIFIANSVKEEREARESRHGFKQITAWEPIRTYPKTVQHLITGETQVIGDARAESGLSSSWVDQSQEPVSTSEPSKGGIDLFMKDNGNLIHRKAGDAGEAARLRAAGWADLNKLFPIDDGR